MDISKGNANQYNNTLLIILLLLVFFKGDRGKQKPVFISNTLEERHTLTEDDPKIVKDVETTFNQLKSERIKANIEKAKLKMLIKELESSAEQRINLHQEKGEVLKVIESNKLKELGKTKIESNSLEELYKTKIESNKLKELDKAKIELNNLEELYNTKIESNKVKEIDKAKIELNNLEELYKTKIELNKVKEPDNTKIESNKLEEIDNIKWEEVNEGNLDREESAKIQKERAKEIEEENIYLLNKPKVEKTEEPNKQDLIKLDKKKLSDTKNEIEATWVNSIMPMEILLKQLVGENITFSTVTGSNESVANTILLSVKDGIVNIDVSSRILSIPLCEIVGVESNLIHSIQLQSVEDILNEQLYEYKEWSLRNLFSTMIGEKVFIETKGSGSFNNINSKIVTNVGQGIVVLDNTMAISLSKIILVERR